MPTIMKEIPSGLRDVFDYDPETGLLRWKIKSGRAVKGKIAGSPHADGYLAVTFKGQKYLAHRVIWLIVHGETPMDVEIDHRNMDRKDNRLSNLRACNRLQNSHNSGKRTINTSGAKNVCWRERNQKWMVRVSKDGVRHYFGLYSSFKEAQAVAALHTNRLHGEFARAA